MRIAIAIIVIVGLIAFYFTMWKLNRKQQLPEEFKGSLPKCGSCSDSQCALSDSKGDTENE